MRCIAFSDHSPDPVQIEKRSKIYDVWLRQNITKEETEEGIRYRYDEAYMQSPSEPDITSENFPEWFERASVWEEAEPIPEPTTEEFLLELAGEHEYRICLLELGVEI